MRSPAKKALPKKVAGKKDSITAAGAVPVNDAVQRLEPLRQGLKELHQAVLAALELLDQAMAAWLSTPQKQQVRNTSCAQLYSALRATASCTLCRRGDNHWNLNAVKS